MHSVYYFCNFLIISVVTKAVNCTFAASGAGCNIYDDVPTYKRPSDHVTQSQIFCIKVNFCVKVKHVHTCKGMSFVLKQRLHTKDLKETQSSILAAFSPHSFHTRFDWDILSFRGIKLFFFTLLHYVKHLIASGFPKTCVEWRPSTNFPDCWSHFSFSSLSALKDTETWTTCQNLWRLRDWTKKGKRVVKLSVSPR